MLDIGQIIEATGGIIVTRGVSRFSGVSIDSRTIREGELFIALKGGRFDGHDYVIDALRKGDGAVISHDIAYRQCRCGGDSKSIIAVKDTLLALQDMARSLRRTFSGEVIGVIGSNGKTTTKELTAAILGVRHKVLKTSGNLNNHVGLPLTITKVESDTEIMVLEMGANNPGEIHLLCDIASPSAGIVTNIGYEHLEGFGTLDTVRDSELEILPYIKRIAANADDAFLMEGISEKFEGETITFGIENAGADVRARDIIYSENGTMFTLWHGDRCITIDSPLLGRFNVYNSLAAAASASGMNIPLNEIKEGLELFKGMSMRFEIKIHRGIVFLNDVYNANPSSMEESLRELVRLAGISRYKRIIAVLGDMLELGAYSDSAHRNIGNLLSDLAIDIFIGVGPEMAKAVEAFQGKGIHVPTSEAASGHLLAMINEGDIVLVKGSRGMRMEQVLQGVMEADYAL